MFRKGRQGCFYCLEESDSRLYCLNTDEGVVILEAVKNRLGDVQLVVKESAIGDIESVVTEKVTKDKLGMPKQINFMLTIRGKEKSYCVRSKNRICPHCYNNRKTINYLMQLPLARTYVIVMGGLPSAGKTAFVKALLHKLAGIGFKNVKLAATPLEDNDKLRTCISLKKGGKLQANIILLDMPGEIYSNGGENAEKSETQVHRRRFNMMDALIYICDRTAPDIDNEELDALLDVAEDLPVAVVVSKADKLESMTSSEVQPKILTKAYFAQKKRIAKNRQLAEIQQAVDTDIIRHCCKGLYSKFAGLENVSYHLVSNGKTVGSDNELDLTECYGVEQVFNDILYRLGINNYKEG